MTDSEWLYRIDGDGWITNQQGATANLHGFHSVDVDYHPREMFTLDTRRIRRSLHPSDITFEVTIPRLDTHWLGRLTALLAVLEPIGINLHVQTTGH